MAGLTIFNGKIAACAENTSMQPHHPSSFSPHRHCAGPGAAITLGANEPQQKTPLTHA